MAAVALAFLGGMLERSALGFSPDEPCPMRGHEMQPATQHLHHEHANHHGKTEKKDSSKHEAAKCFCVCMSSFNLTPAPPTDEVVFEVTPVSFSSVLKISKGRSLVLDPGIPKRTV